MSYRMRWTLSMTAVGVATALIVYVLTASAFGRSSGYSPPALSSTCSPKPLPTVPRASVQERDRRERNIIERTAAHTFREKNHARVRPLHRHLG
jgi:hypothetical protein